MELWVDVVNQALVFGALAISLNLVMGYLGYLSLAHAAFFGIGAYTMAVLTRTHEWPFVPATTVAVLASAVAGLVVALASLRMSGEYVVLMTLAVLSIGNQVARSWVDVTGGATGLFPIEPASLFGLSPQSVVAWVPVLSVVTAVILAVVWRLGESPYGRVLKAIRDDPRATSALGKRVVRFQFQVFAISAAMAGLVGALWGSYLEFVSPTSFGLDAAMIVAAIVVLGGTANPVGSVIAAAALISLPDILAKLDIGGDNAAPIRNVAYGVALILLVRYRPAGLLRESRHVGRLVGGAPPLPEAVATGGDSVVSTPAGAGRRLGGRALSKRFGAIAALDDVDIELPEGQITALIGPNGAGKSTLFNVLTGDLRPDGGTVTLGELDLTGQPSYRTARAGVGRTFQDVRLFQTMSVFDNVVVAVPDQPGERLGPLFLAPARVRGGEDAARRIAAECLSFVRLDHLADRPVNDLAFGDQKLVALARLLAMGSTVMLLDEPSAGTDPGRVSMMLDVVRTLAGSGRTVCLVEHNLDVIRRLEGRAYFLDEGRIVAVDTVDHLMASPALVESYFGGPARERA